MVIPREEYYDSSRTTCEKRKRAYMPVFKEMDPALAAKLIEGFDNELDGEQKKLDAFYRQFRCPKCKGNMAKHFISVQHAFPDGALVPHSGLKCLSCDLVLDPHTGIVVGLGTAGADIALAVAVDDD